MSSCLTSTLRLFSHRFLAKNQACMLHTTPSVSLLKNSNGNFNVTMVPGDGVGPELMDSVQAVLKSINAPLTFDQLHLSEVQHRTSTTLEHVVKSINKNGVALKGVISIPDITYTGELQNLNQLFRNSLDIYANVIQVKSLPGVKAKHKNVDFVVIREQTEGEYSALEHESIKGVVECLKVVTAEKSRRIAKFAFDYATKHGRKKVTAVHKANIMKLGDGLFLRSCEEISKLYPRYTITNKFSFWFYRLPLQFKMKQIFYCNLCSYFAVHYSNLTQSKCWLKTFETFQKMLKLLSLKIFANAITKKWSFQYK